MLQLIEDYNQFKQMHTTYSLDSESMRSCGSIEPKKMFSAEAFFSKANSRLCKLYPKADCPYQIPKAPSDVTVSLYKGELQTLWALMKTINPRAYHFIEKVLLQMKCDDFKRRLLFHLLLLHSPLSSLPLDTALFYAYEINLKMIVSIVRHSIREENYSKMFGDEGFDIYCMIEVLYVSLGAYFELLFFKVASSPKIGNSQLKDDLTSLYLINILSKHLNVLIMTINEINDMLRCNAFAIKEVEFDKKLFSLTNFKWFIEYYSTFTYVLCLIKKYSLYRSMNSLKPHLSRRALDKLSRNLFCIVDDNFILCYTSYKEDVKTKMLAHETGESFIMLGLYRNELYSWLKYLREDYFVDCQSCYPGHNKFNSKFFMPQLLSLFALKLKCLIYSINNHKSGVVDTEELNIALLNEYVKSLKGFLTCHFISSFTNDNVYDVSNKNKWCIVYLDVLCLSQFLLSFSHIVDKFNKADGGLFPKKKEWLIAELFAIFSKTLHDKANLKFPMKSYIYKQKIIRNVLVVLNYFVSHCSKWICPKMKAFTASNGLVQELKALSLSQSLLFFYFSNRILKALELSKGSFKQKLRIYGKLKSPFDYIDIEEESKSLSISSSRGHSLNQLSGLLFSKENKENMSIIANYPNQPPIENPQEAYQPEDIYSTTSFNLSNIIAHYPLKDLRNVFSRRKVKEMMVSLYEDPIVLIQSSAPSARSSDRSDIEALLPFPQENTILDQIQLDITDRESIIAYAYTEFNQMRAHELSNYNATVNHYDFNNSISYFDYLDKLDILLG